MGEVYVVLSTGGGHPEGVFADQADAEAYLDERYDRTSGYWEFFPMRVRLSGDAQRRRELGTFGGPRFVIGPVQVDEDDVLRSWSAHGDDPNQR